MADADAPELVIFCGLQAAGKTSFYRERFLATHVRLSLDLLRTRHRFDRFLMLCLATRMPAVVDNTNPTRAERAPLIAAGAAAGFRLVGYYFRSSVEECLARNAQRTGDARIPEVGLRACAKRLERPARDEGFAALHHVRLEADGFRVEEWDDGLR